jgi:amino acid transporter
MQIADKRDSAGQMTGNFPVRSAREEDPWTTSKPHHSAATAGFAGLSLAAIFAFLSIAGVDSVAPVAEEAHTPRRRLSSISLSAEV